jgi:hypothetical protein
MCFVRLSEQTVTFALYIINRLVFITEVESVYSAVRTDFLYKTLHIVLWRFRKKNNNNNQQHTLYYNVITMRFECWMTKATNTHSKGLCCVDHASLYNLVNKTNLMQNFFCMFISFLYMFQATMCPSSGEITVSVWHLVFVTLCRCLYGMPAHQTVIHTEWQVPSVA